MKRADAVRLPPGRESSRSCCEFRPDPGRSPRLALTLVDRVAGWAETFWLRVAADAGVSPEFAAVAGRSLAVVQTPRARVA